MLEECASRKTVIVMNKSDLPRDPSAPESGHRSVEVSALEKAGLDELRDAVLKTLFPAVPDDIARPIPFTARQVSLLDKLDASNTMEIRRELLCPSPGSNETT
jgi:tRNA U34 5-carboxymethylaminomethyl modifying GTPase MnmE/TrmE